MKVDFLTDQGSGSMNEDDLLVKDGLFCVFDGVTSLVKYISPEGLTGGKLGSFIIKEFFEANFEKPLLKLAPLANKKLRDEMKKRNIDVSDKTQLWGTTLAGVRIDNNFAEYIQIADSSVVFIKKKDDITAIPQNRNIDQITLALYKKLLNQGITSPKNDKRVSEQQRKTRNRVNIDYGTLNGEKESSDFIIHGRIPLEDITHILLLTDGIRIAQENPNEREDISILTKTFLQGGLKAMFEYVRNWENSDPDCVRYPRTKTHDDATAIAITL